LKVISIAVAMAISWRADDGLALPLTALPENGA